jgi:hypothetical protein
MWVDDGNQIRDEKFKEVHGPDVDPLLASLDAKVVMLAGHINMNGRLCIGDDSIDSVTVPSLCQLQHGRKSSQPQVETHPTPLSVAMNIIQVCSSSLVIYISLHVFHCNIHDIARTKYRLGWRKNRLRGDAEAKSQRQEEQMMQQQLTQQQKRVEWMAQKMACYDVHLTVSSCS